VTAEALVDELFGVVRALRREPREPGEPAQLVGYTADVADLGRFTSWQPDAAGTGLGFDPAAARAAALGEAVERYCGNYVWRIDAAGGARELAADGARVVAPFELRQFTADQYASDGFPCVAPSDDVRVEWVEGADFSVPAQPVLLPASAVYLNYHDDPSRRGEPRFHPPLLSGIAAGRTREQAIVAALLEVAERDATSLWWYARLEAAALDLAAEPELEATVWDGVDRDAISLEWLAIPTDLGVPVVACVLQDRERELLTVGFAARADARAAVLKAAAEAFQLRTISSGLLAPDGWMWRALESGRLGQPERFPRPRADRRYLDSFAPDLSDMRGLLHNTFLYLDRRAWPPALERLTPARRVPLAALAGADRPSSGGPAAAFAAAGVRAFWTDLTTPDVAQAGLSVVRVLCPEACPNAPAAFPPLGNRRLSHALARGGGAAEPFTWPQPHS
jgi:ribosomal protein S12 methylthiotransferase accessory factor